MNKDDARDILAMVATGRCDVWFTEHFWKRVRERTPGFNRLHAYRVLSTGVIQGEPIRDDNHQNYKIKVRAKLPDFNQVELVVGVSWLNDAVCITIYEKK